MLSSRFLGQSRATLEKLHELVDLGFDISVVVRFDGALDAVTHVLRQDRVLQRPHGGLDGSRLHENVGAVAAVLEHPSDALHLPHDAVDAFEVVGVIVMAVVTLAGRRGGGQGPPRMSLRLFFQ